LSVPTAQGDYWAVGKISVGGNVNSDKINTINYESSINFYSYLITIIWLKTFLIYLYLIHNSRFNPA